MVENEIRTQDENSNTQIINIQGVDCYEKDGVAYLNLEQVARGLGFTQEKNGVEYVRWETTQRYLSEIGFSQLVGKDVFIPENVFYRLAMKAKNEVAERFQTLVADEIIPSIRRNGIYATDGLVDKMLENPSFMLDVIQRLKIESDARKKAENKVAILTHVNKTYTMTEIAKELNLKSANELNKILADMKIQYKSNGTWVLYSKYSNLGYEDIKQEVLDNGKVVYHRKITQLGREFILGLFNQKIA